MTITRREFTTGSLALAAVAVVPAVVAAEYPRIVGDGVHDNSKGFQSYIDGKPVWFGSQLITGKFKFPAGKYKINNNTLFFGKDWRQLLA